MLNRIKIGKSKLKQKWLTILASAVVIAAGATYFLQPDTSVDVAQVDVPLPPGAIVRVTLPAQLSEQEAIGKRGFDAVCAACHGVNAQGQEGVAPPLVHKIYEPNHHGDIAFIRAAQNGVMGHHWPFGNMPAVEGITEADILNIIAYVRALQRENGIY
ncbi:MAG: cytochrome c [Yoonia sp.]|nr:cytochrome c [Yoonia sp.]MDG1863000.1 cytochrome c [Yoonia sp.]